MCCPQDGAGRLEEVSSRGALDPFFHTWMQNITNCFALQLQVVSNVNPKLYIRWQMAVGFKDPRMTLRITDGIKWVTDAEEGTYDAIIVDSSDPVGPAEVLFEEVRWLLIRVLCRKRCGTTSKLCSQGSWPCCVSSVVMVGRDAK